ncbi:MAG TPA: hypothetical protein PLV48_07400 [Rhodocyclaceae bacterium]|nr:hypothetical protein [Rhodocyclaceae bacterium]HMV52640.1 hypothetical protein [Rhodocyclaceae bacterium]HNA03688.1 hypothetical protein [Rhodocyclaceae bacterium]
MGSFLRRACLALTLIIELFIASVAAQTPAAGDLGQFPLPGNFCSHGEPMWVNGQIRCVGCGGAGEPCCSQSQPRCYGAQQDWACFAGPGAPAGFCGRISRQDVSFAGCSYPGHPPCDVLAWPQCHSGLQAIAITPQILLCPAAGDNGQPCRADPNYPCEGASTCSGGFCIPGENLDEWCRKIAVELDAAQQTGDFARFAAATDNACKPPCPFCQRATAQRDAWQQSLATPPPPVLPPAPIPGGSQQPGSAPSAAGSTPAPPAGGRAWHLKGALAEPLAPLNPHVRILSSNANESRGIVRLQYEPRKDCWETYELSWQFAGTISLLRKGDRIGVTLQSTLVGASCGSALGTYVSIEGPRLEDFLARRARPDQIESAVFQVQAPRAQSSSQQTRGSAQGTIEIVTAAPGNRNDKYAFLRFYAYSPGQFHVVAYVFEPGP